MAEHSSEDGGGVSLLAFLLGAMVALFLAIGVFWVLGSGNLPGQSGGSEVTVNLPSPSSGGGSR